MNASDVIYRAMEEENGLSKLGQTAKTAAVRLGRDIVLDAAGMVHQPSFVPGQPNGVSCSPSIQSLPTFALPLDWGGRNRRTVVWSIAIGDLGQDLIAEDDSRPFGHRHVSIGPAKSMSGDEFRLAIQATQTKWKRIAAPGA